MFEKLADSIFQKKIRSFVNDGKRLKMFVNYKNAKSIFLLFESNQILIFFSDQNLIWFINYKQYPMIF